MTYKWCCGTCFLSLGIPMLNCILVMGLQKHYWFNLWVHIKYATRETGHPVTRMSKWSRGNNEKLYPVLCLAARHSRSVLFVSLLPLCSVFPHHFFLCPKALSHSFIYVCSHTSWAYIQWIRMGSQLSRGQWSLEAWTLSKRDWIGLTLEELSLE